LTHANALLTPRGRLELAELIVLDGWPLRRAADRFQVSPTTAKRWADRYRADGADAMQDRSSRPRSSPNRTPTRVERRIIGLRVNRRRGPAWIAWRLGLHPSTVHRVLSRYGLAKLAWLDRATGRVVRRYERSRPGELVHVDVKKLGKIPDGGGHRAIGRLAGARTRIRRTGAVRGYHFIHSAVDDYSRIAYSEILDDERKETAAGFWTRANVWFAARGITVERVLTDNGACYRSRDFAAALGDVVHKRTRPYRPQTNGKVERYHRTYADEWAYAITYTSDADRIAAFQLWQHHYNHHRPHTALKGQPPISRVTNLPGHYS
jgi:transposase InsO family protein